MSASDPELTKQVRAVAAEVAARRLVREHELGIKKATESKLAAARALILRNSEQRAREVAAGPDGSFKVDLASADMITVAKVWRGVFGIDVSIAPRIQEKKVSLSVADSSLEEFRRKLKTEFQRSGIHLVWLDDGSAVLDSTSDNH